MKCFAHRDADAVGSCRNCGRGLCGVCAGDGDKKLACQGACQTEVIALAVGVARSRAYLVTILRTSAIALSVLAAALLAGAAFTDDRHARTIFSFGGGLFALLAVLRIRQVRRWAPPRVSSQGTEPARGSSNPPTP